MSNYTIEVTENVVNLDVLKDHDIVIEIKSSDNFITFDTPSGYPILFTSGILPVSRVGSGYLIENLTSGNTVVRTFGDQAVSGHKIFTNDLISSGNLAIKAQASFISPSHFPVLLSDPATFARNIHTRTTSQIKSDLSLNNVQNIALSGITFSAGSGLVGGGNLSSSRTFDIGQGDGLTVSADSIGVNSTVVRTTGDQTITGFTTFSGSGLKITTGAIGQYRKDLILKANTGALFNNTVTITPSTNFYTDRIYYVPEAGADGDFVLTVGSQVITGPKTFTSSIVFNSGSFQSLKLGGIDVSVSGHTHTSSNITDFNASVDSRITNANLQPSGNYSVVGHTHTISNVIGLQTVLDNKQASGNYSLFGHTHASSDITDFNASVSGLLPITLLTAGSGIGISGVGSNYTISTTGTFGLTQSQVDSRVNTLTSGVYAPLNSPSFSGVPLTPTATAGTNSTQIASTAFVRTEISNLVASAPLALDTLNELATALGNDANFSTTVTNNLAGKANLSGATFTGSISGPSGNFTSLKVNNVDVSANGHTHTASNITDFNTSVDSRITNANLQPSGNYSIVGHTHTSSNITDFNSSVSGLLPVKDIIAGSGIQVGSTSGTYTITAFGVAASSASSLITRADNMTGATISKMSVVYINGGHGNRPTIQKSIASTESGSSKTYGITASNINDNQTGDIVVFGSLIDVDTNQFGASEGSSLYLSPSVSGGITATKPLAPNHLVTIGKIVRNHSNQGIIEVSIQNGFELYELHDVAVTDATSGQFLQYNSSSGLWVPSSSGNFTSLSVNNTGVSLSGHTHSSSNITNFNSSVSGLLPVGTANYLSKFGTGGSGLGNSLVFDNGTNVGIGTASPISAFHIASSLAGSAANTGVLINTTHLPSSNGQSLSSLNVSPTFSNIYANISNIYGLLISPVSSGQFTTTNSYGLYVNAANVLSGAVTNNYAAVFVSGNVGIGTASPSNRLEVAGGDVLIGPSDSTRQLSFFNNSYGIKAQSGLEIFTGDVIRFRKGSTEYARIDTNGKVGIGTTTPSGQLHTAGLLQGNSVGTTGIILSNSHASQLANGQDHTSLFINPTFLTSSSNLNNTYGLLISPSSSGQYNTTNSYGLYVNASTLASGSITNNYSAVFMGGNVGVGTALPSARLEVSASGTTSLDIAHFSNSNGIEKAKVSLSSAGDGTFSIIDASNNTDIFLTSNASTASYINAGNVGIGTTVPQELLHVSGTISSSAGNLLRLNNSSATTNPSINFRIGGVGNYDSHFFISRNGTDVFGIDTNNRGLFLNSFSLFGNQAFLSYNNNNAFIKLQNTTTNDLEISAVSGILFQSSQSTKMRMDQSGNFGIGTTTPSKKLDVIGDARVSGVLNLVNTSDSTDRSIAVTSNNMTFAGVHGIFEYSIGLRGSRGSACGLESNAANGYLALAAGGSEKVRIATDGKVGIGINSPLDLIHVSGTSTGAQGIRLENADGYGGSIQADNGALSLSSATAVVCRLQASKIRMGDGSSSTAIELTSNGSISQNGNGGGLTFNGTTALFSNGINVTNSGIFGSVGIGTTTPSTQLHVIGSGTFSNSVSIGSSTLSDSNLPSIINSTNLYLWSNFN